MNRWRNILKRWGPRSDTEGDFYGDQLDIERPVLLNTMGPVAAAFVGARVLRAIVARRGTLLKPSAIEKLESLAARGLSEEVVHHCEAEAERILEWIERAPSVDEPQESPASGLPDLDMMMASDLESRLSVAQFALEEDYDLELEYFNEETKSWPRIRAKLLAIDDQESGDFLTTLELYSWEGHLEVPLKYVRWLMPVASKEWDEEDSKAQVFKFPSPRNDS